MIKTLDLGSNSIFNCLLAVSPWVISLGPLNLNFFKKGTKNSIYFSELWELNDKIPPSLLSY